MKQKVSFLLQTNGYSAFVVVCRWAGEFEASADQKQYIRGDREVKKNFLFVGIFILAALIVSATGCGSSTSSVTNNKASKPAEPGKTIVSGAAGNGITVSLANADGIVHRGQQDFTMTFFDATGKAANVSSATLVFKIGAFGTMPEQKVTTTFTAAGDPGSFRGKADLGRVGEWEAQIDFDGPGGKGTLTVPIVVK